MCQCYFDIIYKISGLEIPNEKEDLLSLANNEANKSTKSVIERTELWFDIIKIKLADVNNIINVDNLASGTETPAGGTTGAAASTESSGVTPPQFPHAAPLVTGGKYTPLTPSPGTLEWGCSLSALLSGFRPGRIFGW